MYSPIVVACDPSLALVALWWSTHARATVVRNSVLLSWCHMRKAARHRSLLLEVVRMGLSRRGSKVRLHGHAWLEALVRAARLHHWWSRAVVIVCSRAVLLHVRHMWLSMWRHWRIVLIRHGSVHIALGRVLYHHMAAHLWCSKLWSWRETRLHWTHLPWHLSWHHHGWSTREGWLSVLH